MLSTAYVITDQNNRYARSIYLEKHTKEWLYVSYAHPVCYHTNRSLIEKEKQQLETLAKQAGFDLRFKIIEVNPEDFLDSVGKWEIDGQHVCKIDSISIPYGNFKKNWVAYAAIVPKAERRTRL